LVKVDNFLYKIFIFYYYRESPEDKWMLEMIKAEFVENPSLLQEKCKLFLSVFIIQLLLVNHYSKSLCY